MTLLTTDLSNMTRMQLMEGYVELNLDLEAELTRTGKYPHEIGIKLFDWMKQMPNEDIKKAEEVLEKVRAARAMGNL